MMLLDLSKIVCMFIIVLTLLKVRHLISPGIDVISLSLSPPLSRGLLVHRCCMPEPVAYWHRFMVCTLSNCSLPL
jgi:hypothetical protein